MLVTRDVPNAPAVARRMVWLAFQDSLPAGMGFLHVDAAAKATEADMDRAIASKATNRTSIAADYLFGRMMKLYFEFSHASITFHDDQPRLDYQSWCHVYPSIDALITAALKSLE